MPKVRLGPGKLLRKGTYGEEEEEEYPAAVFRVFSAIIVTRRHGHRTRTRTAQGRRGHVYRFRNSRRRNRRLLGRPQRFRFFRLARGFLLRRGGTLRHRDTGGTTKFTRFPGTRACSVYTRVVKYDFVDRPKRVINIHKRTSPTETKKPTRIQKKKKEKKVIVRVDFT